MRVCPRVQTRRLIDSGTVAFVLLFVCSRKAAVQIALAAQDDGAASRKTHGVLIVYTFNSLGRVWSPWTAHLLWI